VCFFYLNYPTYLGLFSLVGRSRAAVIGRSGSGRPQITVCTPLWTTMTVAGANYVYTRHRATVQIARTGEAHSMATTSPRLAQDWLATVRTSLRPRTPGGDDSRAMRATELIAGETRLRASKAPLPRPHTARYKAPLSGSRLRARADCPEEPPKHSPSPCSIRGQSASPRTRSF